MKYIKSLIFILMPNYWIMNEKYSKVWDKKLNELMDKGVFAYKNRFEAKLCGHTIWVENYPYSCFVPPHDSKFRASRLTILRARRKLQRECFQYCNHAEWQAEQSVRSMEAK